MVTKGFSRNFKPLEILTEESRSKLFTEGH